MKQKISVEMIKRQKLDYFNLYRSPKPQPSDTHSSKA